MLSYNHLPSQDSHWTDPNAPGWKELPSHYNYFISLSFHIVREILFMLYFFNNFPCILGIETSAQYSSSKPFFNLNRSHSEIQLSNYAPLFRLEASSRSLSTWVAVGDTSATTQLPSPQVQQQLTFISSIFICSQFE